MLTGLIKKIKNTQSFPKNNVKPIIIPRAEHPISRHAIHPNALKVLYRLQAAGFSAYLVGGCVRDLLLGLKPKDFDVTTDARPEQIRQLFKNCRLIGRRFRLAHILFGREVIEVATFRTHHENATHEHHGKSDQGMIIRDNVYGTIEDDAWRRDFRINALYYNIADFSIIDYTGGMQDIKNKLLHIIGDPEQRFHEDPVRLLRAVRFAEKLNIDISPETAAPIAKLSHLLHHVSPARLLQEVLKIFQEGALFNTFTLLQKFKLFGQLFPQTDACLDQSETQALIKAVLMNTDKRLSEGRPVSPAFLFTAFLWRPIVKNVTFYEANGVPIFIAFEKALQTVLKQQMQQLAVSRRIQLAVRELCLLQQRLTYRRGMQPYRLLSHPRFRAAYDLLLLRAQAGESVQKLADWWTLFQAASLEQREKMLKEIHKSLPTQHKFRKKTRRSKQ